MQWQRRFWFPWSDGFLNHISSFNPLALLRLALRLHSFPIAGSFPSALRFLHVRLRWFLNPALSRIFLLSGVRFTPVSPFCSTVCQFAIL